MVLATGRVSGYALGDEVALDVASELPEVFLTLIPKETITVQSFPKATDLGFAIPVIFGNAKQVPLTYLFFDPTANVYIYLLSYAGVTPTFVYRDGIPVDASEYTIYNGTYNNSIGGVGGNLTAYSVIVFTKEQLDFQGRLYDRREGNRLTADVTGLQPERNFGRAIRSIISNATWGLGQAVDATSVDQTEADLTAIGGLFCDGALIEQKPAKDYLDQLAGVRGIRFGQTASGAWTTAIDKPATVYDAAFGFNDQPGYRNLLQKPVRNWRNTSEAISTLEMEYRVDLPSGQFRQVTSLRTVSPRGRPKRVSLSFVRDHTTADKWANYQAERLKTLDRFISTTLGLEGIHLQLGNRIVLVAPNYGLNGGFEIVQQTIQLTTMDVELIPYEPDIYIYTPGTLPVDESLDSGADLSRTPPIAPSNLTKPSDGTEQSADGATSAFVDLSWTASPTANVTYVVQLKKNSETNWTTWDEKNTTSTRIRGLIPGIAYDYQALARSGQNLFSASVAQLLNQVAPGDSTPPPTPTAIAVRQGTGKSVEIDVTFAEPADWGTVELYHNTVDNSATATLVETKKAKRFHDANVTYGTPYFYWAKVVDLTGNKSGFSPSTSHSILLLQINAGNEVLDLSVLSAKIADLNVSTLKLAGTAVTTAKRQLINQQSANVGDILGGGEGVASFSAATGSTNMVTAWHTHAGGHVFRSQIVSLSNSASILSSVLNQHASALLSAVTIYIHYW